MKTLLIAGPLLALSLLLTGCPGTSPPPDNGGGIVAPVKATLTVTVTGVSSAPVTVTDASGAVKFSDQVSGSRAVPDLPVGRYTVTGSAVAGYTVSAPATTDLVVGGSSAQVTYTAVPVGQLVSMDTVSGSVAASTLKVETVNAYFRVAGALASEVRPDASGAFSLTLSAPPVISYGPYSGSYAPLLPGNCVTAQGQPLNSPSGDLVTDLLAYGPQNDYIGSFHQRPVGATDLSDPAIYRLYADRAQTISVTCPRTDSTGKPNGTLKVDLTLKSGWNLAVFGEQGGNGVLRALAADARAELIFVPAKPAVSVILSTPFLDFGTASSLTVDATVVQSGGYNGPVTLKSTDPDLSVSPASLTLAPLPKAAALSAQPLSTQTPSAQTLFQPLSVGSQSVRTKLTLTLSDSASSQSSKEFRIAVTDPAGQIVSTSFSGQGFYTAQRPGLSIYGSTYGTLVVSPVDSPRLDYTVSGQNGLVGEVTVTIKDLPAGVVSTSQTQTLSAASAYLSGSLILSATAPVQPGTYTAALTATGRGKTAAQPVTIVVPKPGAALNPTGTGYPGVTLAQAGQRSLAVQVGSVAGFSGPVTVSAAGLPAGVTAEPRTVQVRANEITSLTLTLTAAADAALGNVAIVITATDYVPSSSEDFRNRVALTVVPAQATVPGLSVSLAPGNRGVWRLSTAFAGAAYDRKLERYDGLNLVQSVTLPTDRYWSTLRLTPAGDLYVFPGMYGETDVTVVSPAGAVKRISGPLEARTGFADAAGQFWYVTSGAYATPAALYRWTPGQEPVLVDASSGDTYSSSSRVALNAKGTIGYSFGYPSKVVRFSTASATLTTIDVPSAAQSAAVAEDGTLWFVDYSGKVSRINADKTISTLSSLGLYSAVIGFDLADPDKLWLASSDQIGRYSLSSGQLRTTPVQSQFGTVSAALAGGGGIGFISRTEPYGSGQQAEGISYLK